MQAYWKLESFCLPGASLDVLVLQAALLLLTSRALKAGGVPPPPITAAARVAQEAAVQPFRAPAEPLQCLACTALHGMHRPARGIRLPALPFAWQGATAWSSWLCLRAPSLAKNPNAPAHLAAETVPVRDIA